MGRYVGRLLWLLVSLAAATVAVAAPRGAALVIGNAAYEEGRLRNPVNDAAAMDAALRELGFEVTLLKDANKRTMQEAVEALSQRVPTSGVGLFYFSGHGLQVRGQNYLLPLGARITTEADVEFEAVAAEWVLAKLEEAGQHLQIVILDACRNNPYARRWRTVTRGLERMREPRGSLIAYATAPGDVADDGSGRNGVFTKYLLHYMRAPGLNLTALFDEVRVAVAQETSNKQVPWVSSSLLQKFTFVQGAEPSPRPAPAPAVAGCSAAGTAAWEVVKETTKPRQAQQFLQAHPQGCYALAARLKLEQLQSPPAAGTQVAVGAYPPAQSSAPSGERTLRNSIGMEFVRISDGEFQMGSKTGNLDEQPVHTVRISRPFYLGKHEVTQGQWEAVMRNNPSRFKLDDPHRPVENVSWEEAQEFIRRLNVRESGVRYRLPTEAEWEYAARAGMMATYSFGDNAIRLLDRYAWYGEKAGDTTHPVGQLQPNAWGLYDMHGNVWEWVQDWYGAYVAGPAVDPAESPAGSRRVIRGGSWSDDAGGCRVANRSSADPGNRFDFLGFRLLRTVQ